MRRGSQVQRVIVLFLPPYFSWSYLLPGCLSWCLMVEIVARTQEGRYPGEGTQCVGAGPSGVTVCLSVCLALFCSDALWARQIFSDCVQRKRTLITRCRASKANWCKLAASGVSEPTTPGILQQRAIKSNQSTIKLDTRCQICCIFSSPLIKILHILHILLYIDFDCSGNESESGGILTKQTGSASKCICTSSLYVYLIGSHLHHPRCFIRAFVLLLLCFTSPSCW